MDERKFFPRLDQNPIIFFRSKFDVEDSVFGWAAKIGSSFADKVAYSHLIDRIKNQELGIKEVIVATNPTMEGEATSMYLKKRIREQGNGASSIEISRLGMGIPTGADLEYADETTLREALSGRRVIWCSSWYLKIWTVLGLLLKE